MSAPLILTDRLRLSHPSAEDFEPFAAMWGDPAVTRFIGGQTRDRQDSWLTLLRQAGTWSVLGYGYWSVYRRGTDEYVGEVGFADYKRGIEPDLSGAPEAGWVLKPDYWGQGLASEALNAIHDWLDAERPSRSTCIINPDHAASIRVAEKLRYRDIAVADYKGEPVLVLERKQSSEQMG